MLDQEVSELDLLSELAMSRPVMDKPREKPEASRLWVVVRWTTFITAAVLTAIAMFAQLGLEPSIIRASTAGWQQAAAMWLIGGAMFMWVLFPLLFIKRAG